MLILRKVGLAVLGLSLLSGVGQAQAQTTNFVKPGDTVEIPLPVENANDNGDPGGDTISSMRVTVTGDSTFVTNPTESASQSIAPGEIKTFTPSFVVGSGPNVVDGQTYTVRLKQVSSDTGIDPDPEDPASEVVVSFTIDRTPPITELQVFGSSETTTDGSLIISTSTPIGFNAKDPVSSGVASGLSRIQVILDGTTFSASSNSFTLPEGFHTLRFMGIDNVGNVENPHEIGIFSIPTAPPAATTPAWTTFFHDSRHTGLISGVGPTVPTSSWTAAIGSVDTQVAVSSDNTIYAISSNNLQAINPNGSTRWSFPVGNIPGFSAPSLSSSGVAYIGTATDGSCSPSSQSFLFAVNPNGTQKWALSVPGPACANAFAAFGGTNVGADGTVYVGNALDNNLYAVSPSTGGIKWKYQLNSGSITFSVPAIAQDGTVYIGADGGFLYAVNPDGSLKWVTATGGTHPFAPSVTNDGTILIASDNFIQAFSPLGVNLWSFNGNTVNGFSGSIKATPAIGPDGSIYVSDSFRRIIALNANGSLKWAFAGGSDLFNSKGFPIVDSQSNVYLAAFTNSTTGRGSVISLNPNGTLRWKFPVLDNLNSIALGENGAIYAGGNGGLFTLVQAGLPAAQLSVSATPASLVAGQPTNITATATDSISRPVFGVPVTFSIITGSGTLSSDVVTTDPNGQAIVTYLTGLSDGLQQVRATTGALSAIANVTTVLSGPISSAWSLYSHDAQHTGRIFGVGPTVPFLDWAATIGAINSQVAVSSDNTIHALSENGLSAINADGSSKWNFPVIGVGGFYSGPSLASNGAIYIGTPTDGSCLSNSNAFLYALKSDGTQKWALRVPGPRCLGALQAFGGTNVGVDGTIYVGNALDNNLYAVAPDTGGINWKFYLNSGSITFSVPAIAQDGTIYIGADGGFLYAINPNGSLKWVIATAGSHVFTPSITNSGTILIASDNFLQAFSPTGSPVWTFNGNSIGGFSGGIKATPAIGPDGSIYFSDSLRKIVALNANGTLKWAFDGGADLFNSGGFPIVDSQNNIYAAAFTNSATGHGSIISLNPGGTLRWKFPIQDNLNMIALGENGIVYTGGAGGKLYAIEKYYLAKSSDSTVELLSNNPAITVAVASTATANLTLALAAATTQGLILASSIYDISLDTPLIPPGTLTFSFDPTLADTGTLALFRFDGVQWSSSSATGITSQAIVSSPNNSVVATLAHTSLYALFIRDNLPPRTTISMGNPKFIGFNEIFIAPMTPISLSALDDRQRVGDGLGLGVTNVYYSVDLSPFQAYAAPFTISTEGTHVVRYYSVDTLGHAEIIHTSTVSVDNTAPISQIDIIGSAVSFTGADPVFGGVASGLHQIFFSMDGGSFAPFQNPFTPSEGFHTFNFYGVDNVANAETPNGFSAFFGAAPSTVTWTGLAGDGNWHTPSNWQPQKVPGPNDTAVLTTRDSVLAGSGSPAIYIHNLVLGDADGLSAPILVFSTGVLVTGQATLHKNSILTQNTTALWRIGAVKLLAGSKLEHSANVAVKNAVLNLDVPGDFDLQAGASITLSGQGFASSLSGGGGTPGFGPGASAGSSGAGYGGPGGQTQGGQGPGQAYGSIVEPVDLGSGGGGGDNHPGGFGGGALLLQVGGTFKLNGVIAANGGDGIFYSNPCCGGTGGGSGGTVNIRTNNLIGTGLVSADGGIGSSLGGGGGGGRIALRVAGTDLSNLILSAATGSSGGSGTIYVQRPGQNPTLIVKSPAGTPAGSFTPISSASVAGSSLTLSDFTMGSSMAQFIGLTTVKITGMAAFTGVNTISNVTGESDFPGGPTGFPAGSDVTIATMTFPAVSTLTLTGTTLRVSSLTALGHVILSGNSILQQDSAVEWTIGSLSIGNGSKLTHKANANQRLYRVNARVLGNMTVDSGGTVNADGLGFLGGNSALPGFGPGAGAGSVVNGGGGASYGGLGGTGHGGTLAGTPYGQIAAPSDLGSGGGGSNGVTGGAGGGEISLSIGGTLTVNGIISAKGISGNTNSSYGAGGGSGGTIYLSPLGLAGTGVLSAAGASGGAGSVRGGGGGSGGRISFSGQFTGTASVAGGAGGGLGQAGGFGTIGPFSSQSTQTVGGLPEAAVTASQNVSLSLVEAVSAAGTMILATAAVQGIYPVSNIYNLGPEGVLFSPALLFTFRYSTTTLAVFNIFEADIFLYQFVPGTGLVKVLGQIRDTQRKEITVEISMLASNFAIFGTAQDATAPTTALQLSGPKFTDASGATFISSGTAVGFSAVDPIVLSTASGVALTEFRVDATTTAPFQLFAGPFTLPQGPHTLDFRSQDKAGNLEVAKSSAVTVDATAPSVAISSPLAGQVFVATKGVLRVNFTVDDNLDPNPQLSAVLVEIEDRGSPRGPRPASVPVTSGQAIAPLDLDDGLWQLQVSAADFVLNSTHTASGVFEIVHDTLAPRTSIFIGQPQAENASGLFIARTTSFTLSSIDDLVSSNDGVGLGVAFQQFIVDGATRSLFVNLVPVSGQVFSSSFTLANDAEGFHVLSFLAQDILGYAEHVQTITVAVDNTPPSTGLAIREGRQFPGPDDSTFYASSDTTFAFPAHDPAVNGAASGLAFTQYQEFSGPFQTFVSSFALPAGAHFLSYQSRDNVQNLEVLHSTTVLIDALPPATLVNIGSPTFTAAGGDVYVATSALVTFASFDGDISLGRPGSGVESVQLSIDSAPFAAFAPPLTLAEGRHTIVYRAIDNVGNVEAARATRLQSDGTPAASAIAYTGPQVQLSSSAFLISTQTQISFQASDPTVSEVASGVAAVFYRVSDSTGLISSTASFQRFDAAFQLGAGSHLVEYWSRDNAGNAEPVKMSSITVDAPALAISISSPMAGSTFTPGDKIRIVFSVMDNFDPAPQSAALLTQLQDKGSPRGTRPSQVAVRAGDIIETQNLDDGIWELAVSATDFLNNHALAASGPFEIIHDVQPPRTALTVGLPQAAGSSMTFVTGQTLFTLTSADDLTAVGDGLGLGASLQFLSVDGVARSTFSNQNPASGPMFSSSFTLSDADGIYVLAYRARDILGNQEIFGVSTMSVDNTAPITALTVQGPSEVSGGVILIEPFTPLLLTAADSGSGVQDILLSVNASGFASSTAPFTLASGTYTLSFYSRDNVGNQEALKTAQVNVQFADTTPPLVRLDFPSSSGLGVEQAVGGIVNVRGAVLDGAASWTLEAAPGASAASGFAAIASGAGDISGLISEWNTTGLSGYRTLRLRAADALGNAASASATVFVGSPVFTYAIGRKDSNAIVSRIKNPAGIAIRLDGLIWVASADEDKLLLLTSSGAVVASVDGKEHHGHRHGHNHNDDDDDDRGFKNPQGLALDAAKNLYVADKGNDRVVKLSADGSQLLLQIARLDNHGKPKAGSGAGELRRPQDVAVDGNGDIYVADSGNHRVQVFNSSGTFLRQFGPGVLLSTSEVRGIALTTEGLWVSDKELERVFLFSRFGSLIKSIGDEDSVVGELSRMRGLTTDRLGALYVVEPNRDRTQKFDPQGKGLLAFGSKAGLSQADKQAKRYLTQPIDAAIAPDGSIWITDTGRDRIVRYALPAAGASVAELSESGPNTFFSGPVEPAKRVVDALDGAQVERDDGAAVLVPEAALAADLEITVDKGDENQDKEQKTAQRRQKNIQAVSEEVQYGPEGTLFNAPVTLTLPYDANLASSSKEEDLKVYYWNPALKDWTALASVVDKQNHTVSAQTNHFSAYQVQGPGGAAAAAVLDAFGLREGYAFPNPSRRGAPVIFRIQPGLADSVEVQVYDVSGRKVHSSANFRFMGALDDGNGQGAQNTYDHVWDVSGVGSGVYTFMITAKKAGHSDIRKTGKAGVLK